MRRIQIAWRRKFSANAFSYQAREKSDKLIALMLQNLKLSVDKPTRRMRNNNEAQIALTVGKQFAATCTEHVPRVSFKSFL